MQISVEDIKTIHIEKNDTLLIRAAKGQSKASLDKFLSALEDVMPDTNIILTNVQANLTIVRRRKGE